MARGLLVDSHFASASQLTPYSKSWKKTWLPTCSVVPPAGGGGVLGAGGGAAFVVAAATTGGGVAATFAATLVPTCRTVGSAGTLSVRDASVRLVSTPLVSTTS